jgi:hypothetical protein
MTLWTHSRLAMLMRNVASPFKATSGRAPDSPRKGQTGSESSSGVEYVAPRLNIAAFDQLSVDPGQTAGADPN